MRLIEDGYRICTDDLLEGQLDSRLEVHMLVDLGIFDELHEHFGISIGLEGITLLHESGFEHGVVLDDTVMDDREPLGLRVMRMRIDSIGFSVGSPTRMRDTDTSVGIFLGAERFQFGYFSFCLIDIQFSFVVDERYSGTVISAVLETMKTLYQDRIRFALTDISYNSTHKIIYDLVIYHLQFGLQNYYIFLNYARFFILFNASSSFFRSEKAEKRTNPCPASPNPTPGVQTI